jgi:spore maturation protein CgeB
LTALGCQVINLNFGDRLDFYCGAHLERNGEFIRAFNEEAGVRLAAKGIEAAAFEVWPDLVFITSGFFVPPTVYELLRVRGMRVVLNQLEAPYEDVRQMMRAALVDACLINDPTNLESFRAVNPNTWYMPAAHDPDIHRPGPAVDELRCDFGFVGTGFDSRIRFFEQVDWTGVDVAFAGNWADTDADSPLRKFVLHDLAECFPNERAVELYRSAKVSANLYRKEADAPEMNQGWAMSPREVELAATGCFFLRESRGEGDEVLAMLPVFDTPGDFEEKLRWYLTHETARHDMAEAARAAVADRTFVSNARALLRLLA